MKKITFVLGILLAVLLCMTCTASCETIVCSDGDIQATFTLDTEAAYIGRPYTFRYELSGGSGEFSNVQLMYNYDFSWGGGRGYADNGRYGAAAEYTLLPEMGAQLSFMIYGSDSAGRNFYINTPVVPLYPNPELPVTLTFESESAAVGTPFAASYSIAGCQDFNGTISWTVCNSQTHDNSPEVGEQAIEGPNGTVLFTPSFGDAMYLVLSGQDEQGRLVYAESEAILIEGAEEAPINFTYTLSAEEAFIGQPITLHYELSGGSGEFSDVQIMYNYDFGWGGGRGYADNGRYGAAANYTLLPEMGVQLCFSVYGNDSAGRDFYFQTDVMPLHPNPDLPVTITFDKTQLALNETVTASYVIDGCESFTGTSSWTIREENEHRNSSEVDPKPLNAPAGEVVYSPSFGNKMWLVLQGQDAQGRFVYIESDPVEITGAVAEEITAVFTTPEETAYIGQPFTVQYELHGGSGEFNDVKLQALFPLGSGTAYGGFTDPVNAKAGESVIVPEEGKRISIQIHGYDTAGKQFYIDLGREIPLLPNPELPVTVTFDREAVSAGQALTASYKIDGCTGFTGTLSWTVGEKGEHWDEYSQKLEEQTISGTSGTVSFTPSFGDYVYLVLKGQDDQGRFVYVESEQIQISADVQPEPPVLLPGDASGDGQTDIFDALAILQYAVGWDVEVNVDAGDVDDDGKCDIFDALLILQYSVGWDVELK